MSTQGSQEISISHSRKKVVMDGSDYIIELLVKKKIDTVFTVPGAQIDTLFNKLSLSSAIKPVVCSHEAGAAFMADGYARMKNVPGVVLVNGGPGLSNLVTEISVAQSENVPLLVISGDVPTELAHRQAFQDAGEWGLKDLFITRSITKYSCSVQQIGQLSDRMEKAFDALEKEPKGAAHVIIPSDLFSGRVPEKTTCNDPSPRQTTFSSNNIEKIEELLLNLPKILIYAGESLKKHSSLTSLIKVCEHYSVPVLTTYGSKGLIPENHPLNFGNSGYAGRKFSNQLLLSKSLEGIIYLGAKLNERNTLNWNSELFSPERTSIHVDFDTVNTMFDRYKHIQRIIDSPRACLTELADKIKTLSPEIIQQRNQWLAELHAELCEYSIPRQNSVEKGLEPAWIVEKLNKLLPDDAVLFVDSGQHRVFPGFYYRVTNKRSFFTSSITSSTGWAVCAAIGAKKADPEKPVYVISGDTCMRMHGLDIQTAVREKLPVVFLVFNNRTMGSVLARQMKLETPLRSLVNHYDNNWKMFAESFGAYGANVDTEKSLDEELKKSAQLSDKPSIIDINLTFPSYLPEEIFTKSAFA